MGIQATILTSQLLVGGCAGAPKAGTTATAQYLLNLTTTTLCASRIQNKTQKEPHYFDNEQNYRNLNYTQLFVHCDETALRMDATPNYIWYALRIKQTYQKVPVKVLFLLREPVSREISWYFHVRRLLEVDQRPEGPPSWAKSMLVYSVLSFQEHVEKNLLPVVNRTLSTYVTHLRKWVALFDRSQIMVLNYDEVRDTASTFLRRLHSFLDLPDLDIPEGLKQANTKHSEQTIDGRIDCKIQDELAGLYEPYNQELYKLLNDVPGPTMEQRPFPKFHHQCTGTLMRQGSRIILMWSPVRNDESHCLTKTKRAMAGIMWSPYV